MSETLPEFSSEELFYIDKERIEELLVIFDGVKKVLDEYKEKIIKKEEHNDRKETMQILVESIEAKLNIAEQLINYLVNYQSFLDKEKSEAIYKMARSCLFLNYKLFNKCKEQLADLSSINPGLADLFGQTWEHETRFLLGSTHNDLRELYRESLMDEMGSAIRVGDTNHLERFLPNTKGKVRVSMQWYLKSEKCRFLEYVSLSIPKFIKYILENLNGNYEDLTHNEFLIQIEEELASIKQVDLYKVGLNIEIYRIREIKKLGMIRDLRFGRITIDSLKREIAGSQ